MKKLRWQQRFENFERAYLLLDEALTQKPQGDFSNLEKEGIVQRFEYTFELAWETLKDYLEYSGIVFEQVTPRTVIKQAFAAKIIQNGQGWIKMLEHRNLMSHTYNPATFERAIQSITNEYLAELSQAYKFLKEKDL